MAIFLDEDEIGVDATMIGYPHLLLCMGVAVVMNDGSLIGAHVSNQATEANVLNGLLQKVAAHGGAMAQLYCFANMAEHVTPHPSGLHTNVPIAAQAPSPAWQGSPSCCLNAPSI